MRSISGGALSPGGAAEIGNNLIPSPEELTCQELIELVTDYLEEKMSAPVRNRFEAHLSDCERCEGQLDQMRQALKALGSLPKASLSPEAKRELLWLFRRWKQLH